MFRQLMIGSFSVFMLSLLLWIPNVSFADESDKATIDAAMEFAENKANAAQHEIDKLGIMKDAANALIDKWAANKSKIKSGIELTLAGAFGTTASAVANIFTGGTLTMTTKTAGLFTLKAAIDLGAAITAHSGYVDAMNAAINAVDAQIEKIERAKVVYSEIYDDDPNTYNGAYERYLGVLSGHTGWTKQWIDNRVNMFDEDDDKFPHKDSVTPSHKHFGDERRKFAYEGLPYKYECEGPCIVIFRSPHQAFSAHRVPLCGDGTAGNVDTEYESSSNKYYVPGSSGNPEPRYRLSKSGILKKRKVEQGCGRPYYDCPTHPDTEHQVVSCVLTKINPDGTSGPCGAQFRRCMGHTFDHNPNVFGSAKHSDKANSTTEETTETPSTPSTPTMHVCNVHQAWQSGDHSAAGCGTSGHYACDGSNHAAAGCGHASHYACDGLTHVQEQCTITNANGDRCTYTFWRCLHPTVPSYGPSHVHAYPPPPLVACGRAACTARVSSSTAHQATCSAGHTYWTCNLSAVAWHATPLTCQRSGCSVSLTKCQNTGGGGCFSNGTEYSYHDLP